MRPEGKATTLRLHNGQVIAVTGRPAQGTRHRVLIGREQQTGAGVVVKIELIPGALETERRALAWLTSHHGPAARLRGASRVRVADDQDARCLVLDHALGNVPDRAEGWFRIGRALASLTTLPCDGAGLPARDADAFGHAHAARVQDLGPTVTEAMAVVDDWDRLSSPRLPIPGPLVLTHGDPGPGNFLDDGHAGTLIDWEEAQIAPRGLDLARAVFIALLGSGPEGFAARDPKPRARAVRAGYLSGLNGLCQPSRDEQRWWLAVAGIQFAHRRHQRQGQPGVLPWQDALAVLATALQDRPEWSSS